MTGPVDNNVLCLVFCPMTGPVDTNVLFLCLLSGAMGYNDLW